MRCAQITPNSTQNFLINTIQPSAIRKKLNGNSRFKMGYICTRQIQKIQKNSRFATALSEPNKLSFTICAQTVLQDIALKLIIIMILLFRNK